VAVTGAIYHVVEKALYILLAVICAVYTALVRANNGIFSQSALHLVMTEHVQAFSRSGSAVMVLPT
jgi:hypothetical protein